MKRNGLIVAVVLGLPLALLGGGLPYWFGLEIEKAFRAQVESLGRSVGMTVASQRIERGWLATEAETVLCMPGLPFDIVMMHQISHGPLPLDRWLAGEITWKPLRALARSRIELRLSPAAAGAGDMPPLAVLAQLPPLVTDTIIHLDGTGMTTFAHSALRTQFDRGALDWRGLHGELRFDALGKTLDLAVHTPGLSLSAAPLAEGISVSGMSLDNLSLDSRLARGVGGYFFGESRFAVDTFAIAPFIEMRGLRFVSAATPEGRNVTLALTYELDSATVAGQALGPARLAMTVRRLDAAQLARFETELSALTGRDMPAEQTSHLILAKTLELAASLAKNTPVLEVTALSLRIGADEIRGQAKFVLDGSRLNVAENPLLLVAALKGEAELTVPARLLARWYLPRVRQEIQDYAHRGLISEAQATRLTPERLVQITEQVLPHYLAGDDLTRRLVRDGADYKLRLNVRLGQVLINNEPWQPRLTMMP